MKKIYFFLLIAGSLNAAAQNVGVGTSGPIMKLHISSPADTALLLIDNNTVLNTGVNAGAYFRSGGYYTGAIKTTGASGNTARLGLYTYASTNTSALLERLSIMDNGFTGIGTINPLSRLQLSGNNSADSALLTLENNVTHATGVNNGMYFKSTNYYTGAIKTTGTSVNSARLSFYTFASPSIGSMKERMSILDNGNVGINNINPLYDLDLAGNMNAVFSSTSAYTSTFTNITAGKGAVLARLGNPTGIFLGSAAITAESDSSASVPALRAVSKTTAVSIESNHPGYSSIFAQNTNAATPTVAQFYGNVQVKQTAQAPANSGNLTVEGVFNYPDNAGTNKVFTSDATGNASWKVLPAKALLAYLAADFSVTGNNANNMIPFSASQPGGYNDFGASSLDGTGKFTVPAGEGGLYQVTLKVRWSVPNNYAGSNAFTISILRNGVQESNVGNYVFSNATSLENRDMTTSIIFKLNAGDYINLSGLQFSGLNQFISSANTYTFVNIVRLN
jgi:hypothetical protein